MYTTELEKEVTKLREALSIAATLGLTSPLSTDSVDNEKNNLMIDEVRRLYKLGSKALEAEITALQNRKHNESFIPGLSTLLQQSELLSSVEINKDNIQPIQIDLAAELNEKPIKPRKFLILAVSIILGLFMGIFTALFAGFITRVKKEK